MTRKKFFYSFRPIPRLGSRDSSRRSRLALRLLDHPHPFRGTPSPDPKSKSGFSSNLQFPDWSEHACPSRRRGGDPPFLLALLFRSPRLLPRVPSLSAARERRDSAARLVIGGGWARPGACPPAARSPGQLQHPPPPVSDQLQPDRAPLAPRVPSRSRPPAAAARSVAWRASKAPSKAGCGQAKAGPAVRTATTAARHLRPESPGGGRPSRRGR